MGVNRINKVLKALNIPPANTVAEGMSLFVCDATEEEWNEFTASDNIAYKANFMEWRDNKIYIVEFPGEGHDLYACALGAQFVQNATLFAHLQHLGTSFFATGSHHMPDLRYRPRRRIVEPLGAVLPAGVTDWRDFATLLVEVDVSQGWTNLDAKVVNVWALRPTIAYVLCIYTDDALTHAEYKRWELPRVARRRAPPVLPINNATSLVALDAHRLLGLPPLAALPPNFPDPVELDLYAALILARDF